VREGGDPQAKLVRRFRRPVRRCCGPPLVKTKGEASDNTWKASLDSANNTGWKPMLVHRLISGRHTAVGDLADFQGASDEHTLIRT
jgi:hypothetical protein